METSLSIHPQWRLVTDTDGSPSGEGGMKFWVWVQAMTESHGLGAASRGRGGDSGCNVDLKGQCWEQWKALFQSQECHRAGLKL